MSKLDSFFFKITDLVLKINSGETLLNQENGVAKNGSAKEITENIVNSIQQGLSENSSSLLGIGAGIAMVGALGTGVGQGIAVGRGLDAISRNPELFSELRSTLLLGLAITESSAIYCLVVAIILMFK